MPASMKHLNQLVDERERPSGYKSKNKKSVTAVLAKWRQDQKFYSCEILVCDKKDRKCKVRFEDDLECWLEASDIHLQMCDELDDDQIFCCICDDNKNENLNELVICDTCQQSYHINCHKPTPDREQLKLNDDMVPWTCVTCDQLLNLTTSSQATQSSTKAKSQSIKAEPVKKDVKKAAKVKEEKVSDEKVEKMEVEEVEKKEEGVEKAVEKKKEIDTAVEKKTEEDEKEEIGSQDSETEAKTSSSSTKKSRAMKPKSLNTGSQKVKKVDKKDKTTKIKLASGKEKKEKKETKKDEMIPSTASITEKLCE